MGTSRFTPEFKEEAVRQITERGYSVAEVSDRLGVSAHSLYKWLRAIKPDNSEQRAAEAAFTHVYPLRAQYYPRHACPLCAAIIMQLHPATETAPEQVGNIKNGGAECMQNDALNACIALMKLIIGNARLHLLSERDPDRQILLRAETVRKAKTTEKRPRKITSESKGFITPPKLVKSLILASCSGVNIRRMISGIIRKKIITTGT